MDTEKFDMVFRATKDASINGMDKIDKPESRKSAIITISIVLSVIFFFCVVLTSQIITRPASIIVEGETIELSNAKTVIFEDSFHVSGTLSSSQSVSLTPNFSGKVDAIFIENGSVVEKGQELFSILNDDVKSDLGRANGEVARAISTVEEIKVRIANTQLEQKRRILSLEGEIVTIINTLEGRRLLAREGFASTNSVESLERDLSHRRELLSLEKAAATELSRSLSDQLSNAELLLRQAQTEKRSASESIEKLSVRAPITGQLSGFKMNLGESVTRDQEVAVLRPLDKIVASAKVDEYYLSLMKQGQSATIAVSGFEFSGVLSRIESDITEGKFEAEWTIDNPEEIKLWPIEIGQSLRIRHIVGNEKPVIALPLADFDSSRAGSYVFVLGSDGIAHKRIVTFGRKNEAFIEISNGLQPDETVIISTYDKLNRYEQIRVK